MPEPRPAGGGGALAWPDDGCAQARGHDPATKGVDARRRYLATFLTVSQVRVVTSLPNVFSMSDMNTGPRGLGT